MKKGIYIMNEAHFELVYPAKVQAEIAQRVEMIGPRFTAAEVNADLSILQDVDVILSGWGGLQLTEEVLAAAPKLKAVFHAGGTVKGIVTDAFWERDIVITTANLANAIPVAEYTLSQILFSLKSGWQFVRELRATQSYPTKPFHHIAGGFNSVVGLISFSTIAKEVAKLLEPFHTNVLVYDPYATMKDADKYNLTLCTLEELFEHADVVSLHTPLLPETEGMIKGAHFELMKQNATFINTARGAIVNETEMIDVLKKRTDLTAILDVVHPEPPAKGSPLYTMDNIVLTPHIAGSEGKECERMGTFMLAELKRFTQKLPLQYEVTKEQFKTMA